MSSDPVAMVANSVYCHNQSIGLEIYDSDTALRPDWNEVALRHASSTSVIVFVQEHSASVLALHLAKRRSKYHLSDVAGKCTKQSIGHQWHHTIRIRKSDVGSCFRQFHEEYHDPINGIQHLEPTDMCSCLVSCRWINSNSYMIRNILFTDEAHFTRDGINNTINSHCYVTVMTYYIYLDMCIPDESLSRPQFTSRRIEGWLWKFKT